MGLGGAILAEQSACVFRRASQHTIQWAWGGEICSFPPQGRRTARVSKIRNREGEIGRERSQGRTATTPSTMHTLLRHGVGRMAVKFPTFRSPSSRGLLCFPAQGRETSNKGGKPPTSTSTKPPPSEIQSFFQSPPPPITRQHAEGGSEHFSVSPLPTPAVARDRQCCTRVGEKRKRKIGGESPRSQF